MIVGILQVELAIPESGSLKDKRSVIRSLKDHLRRDLKLSASEVAQQDNPALGVLGMAIVTTDGRGAGTVLDHATEMVRREARAEVVTTRRWITRVQDLAPSAANMDQLDATALASEMLTYVSDADLNEADLGGDDLSNGASHDPGAEAHP